MRVCERLLENHTRTVYGVESLCQSRLQTLEVAVLLHRYQGEASPVHINGDGRAFQHHHYQHHNDYCRAVPELMGCLGLLFGHSPDAYSRETSEQEGRRPGFNDLEVPERMLPRTSEVRGP